jgi:hypothetical protein
VDTDDTFTDVDLVRFADALSDARLPVVVPFRFDLAPDGMVLDTATPSRMALRPADGTDTVSCTVLNRKPGRGGPTRTAAGATLSVPLDDPALTLLVQVPARYAIGDADLARFAAGIHLTADARPADG